MVVVRRVHLEGQLEAEGHRLVLEVSILVLQLSGVDRGRGFVSTATICVCLWFGLKG